MGQSIIQMTPQEAESQASRIDGYEAEVESVIANLSALVTGLESGWKGDAFRAYAEQFDQLKGTVMKDFCELLKQISTQLRSVSSAMQQADAEIAGKIRGGR